ncbi:MAG: TipAS antibiotic-recognition domain-containing protein [Aggregatilineales bacterium]
MSKKAFDRTDAETQKDYDRQARLQYDPQLVNDSIRLWNSYSKTEQDDIMEQGNQIYRDIAAAIDAGEAADSSVVQTILERWHDHMRYFYEPRLEILEGLGEMYNTDPRFMANFEKIHPQLPAYLQQAIGQYTDDLATVELERMLAEDEAIMQQRTNRLSGL